MPTDNVEITRRANDALNRLDWRAWLEAFDPGLVYHDHAARDVVQIVRGSRMLMAFLQEWIATFEDLRREVDELIDAGDHVVSVGHWRGTGKRSGVLKEFPETIVWAFHEGRIRQGWALSSREDALALAGRRSAGPSDPLSNAGARERPSRRSSRAASSR